MDSVLLPFLLASDESEAERLLADLFSKYARPVIESTVKSAFGQRITSETGYEPQEKQDIQDIVSDVSVRVLDRLRRLKESPQDDTVNNFSSYVAVTAHNACHAYWRAKHPNRTRLKNRIRYALILHPDFEIWAGAGGRSVCGLSHWKDQRRPANRGWINEARMDPQRLIKGGTAQSLIKLIEAAFESAKAPIHLEDLVSIVAEIQRVVDEPPTNHVELADLQPTNLTADPGDAVDLAAQRAYFKRLWNEILQLPLSQRVALLLGVKDDRRRSTTTLFSRIGIASIREIAQAVGMSTNEFVDVIKTLPLDDMAIGKRLGVSRQQVISCRLAARRRLARRMRLKLMPKTQRSAERL